MAKFKWKATLSGGDESPTSAKMIISYGGVKFIRSIDDIDHAPDDEDEILKEGLKTTFGKKKGKKLFKKLMKELEKL